MEEISKNLDLNDDETKVLRIILMKSSGTAGSVAEYLGLPVAKVEAAIKSLMQKNLVKPIKGKVARYIAVTPFAGFLKFIGQYTPKIEEAIANIKKLQGRGDLKLEGMVQETLASLDKQLKEQAASFDSSAKKQLESLRASLKTASQVLQKGVGEKYDTLVGSTRQNVTGFKGDLTLGITTNQQAFKDETSKLLQKILDDTNKLKATLFDTLNSAKTEVQDLTRGAATDAVNLVNAYQTEVKSQLGISKEKSVAEVMSGETQWNAQLEQFTTSISQSLAASKEASKKKLDSVTQTLVTQGKAMNSEYAQKVTEKVNPIRTITEQLYDGSAKLLQEKMGGASQAITSKGGTFTKILQDQVNKLKAFAKETIATEVKKAEQELKETEVAFTAEITGMVKKFTETIDSLKTGFLDKMRGRIVHLKDVGSALEKQLTEGISANATETVNQVTTLSSEFTGVFTSASKEISGKLAEVKNNASKSLGEISGAFIGDFGAFSEVFSKKSDAQVGEIAASIATLTDDHTKKLGTLVADGKNKFNQIATNIKTQIDGNLTQLETQVAQKSTELSKQVDGKVNAFKDVLAKKVESQVNSTNTIVTGFSTSFGDSVKKDVAAVDAKISTLKDTFNTKVDAQLQSFDNFQAAARLLNQAKEHGDGLTEVIDTVQATISGVASTQVPALGASVQTKVNEGIAVGQKTIETELGKRFSEILDTLNVVKDAGAKPQAILQKAWDEIMQTDASKAELTWHLIGEDSIYPYINAMIENCKSNIMLIVPSLKNLPLDKILGKKTRKFTIVSDVPGDAPNDKIEAMLAQGVRLMDYKQKDFIGAVRDNEEILFAPIWAPEGPTTAVISEVDAMVKHLGSMLTDYWHKSAQKYPK